MQRQRSTDPIHTTSSTDPVHVTSSTDLVDGHVMRGVGLEERTRVGLTAGVKLPLFGTHQEQVVLLFVEVERGASGGGRGHYRWGVVGWGGIMDVVAGVVVILVVV